MDDFSDFAWAVKVKRDGEIVFGAFYMTLEQLIEDKPRMMDWFPGCQFVTECLIEDGWIVVNEP